MRLESRDVTAPRARVLVGWGSEYEHLWVHIRALSCQSLTKQRVTLAVFKSRSARAWSVVVCAPSAKVPAKKQTRWSICHQRQPQTAPSARDGGPFRYSALQLARELNGPWSPSPSTPRNRIRVSVCFIAEVRSSTTRHMGQRWAMPYESTQNHRKALRRDHGSLRYLGFIRARDERSSNESRTRRSSSW